MWVGDIHSVEWGFESVLVQPSKGHYADVVTKFWGTSQEYPVLLTVIAPEFALMGENPSLASIKHLLLSSSSLFRRGQAILSRNLAGDWLPSRALHGW